MAAVFGESPVMKMAKLDKIASTLITIAGPFYSPAIMAEYNWEFETCADEQVRSGNNFSS